MLDLIKLFSGYQDTPPVAYNNILWEIRECLNSPVQLGGWRKERYFANATTYFSCCPMKYIRECASNQILGGRTAKNIDEKQKHKDTICCAFVIRGGPRTLSRTRTVCLIYFFGFHCTKVFLARLG